MVDVSVRAERPDDAGQLRAANDAAFGGPTEGQIVDIRGCAGRRTSRQRFRTRHNKHFDMSSERRVVRTASLGVGDKEHRGVSAAAGFPVYKPSTG